MKFELDLPERQIAQLREALDTLPLWPSDGQAGYSELITKLLPQLPMVDPSPEKPLASRTLANGMKLDAYTPRGALMLEDLEHVLCKGLP